MYIKRQQDLLDFKQDTKEKNIIPIVFSCNNNYAIHLCCAITSILENANDRDFYDINIIYNKKNLNIFNKRLLKDLQNKNCSISFSMVEEAIFEHLPLATHMNYITKETYYRFILPELLPNYNKVLYLDCDIIVQKSLLDLYNIDIDSYYFAGISDHSLEFSVKRLNLTKYCNAGVLLINLKKWQEEDISDKLFEFTKNNSEKLVFLDQDVINIVMQEGIKLLPTEWNTQVYNGTSSNVNDFKFIERSAIIHYIGNIKPWSLYYKFAIKKFYFLYLRKLSLKYNVVFLFLQIREYLYNFYSKTKYYRKKIVWYDKTNKKLILFTKIKIG